MPYYAWTNFDVERNEFGQTTNVIRVGESVTQDALKISDDDWADLIATGAVREQEYPDIPADVSPAEYFRQRAASDDATDEELLAYADALAQSGTADTDVKLMGASGAEGTDTAADKVAEAPPAEAPKASTTQAKPAAATTESSS